MKIGILQAGSFPTEMQKVTGDVDNLFKFMLTGQEFEFETFMVFEDQFPATAEDCDGWIVTGSRAGAYEDHAWLPPLEDLIREAVTLAKPIVGICFGHQLIAQALGGKVEKNPEGWSVGMQQYDFGGMSLPLNAWHQDIVVEVPEGARVIASSDTCKAAGILYGDRALSFQFHPEFGPDAVEGLVHYAAPGKVPDEQVAEVMQNLGEPTANEVIADQIADFFRMSRQT